MTEDQKTRACPAGSRNSNGRKLAKSGRKEPSPHMVAAKIAFDSTKHPHLAGMVMSSATHISTLYREFADALTDVLAENAVGLASRGRLARTRAAVKKHPDYSEHGYFLAVEMAFKQWEAMQNVGSPQKTADRS